MHGWSAAKLSGNRHGKLVTESGTPERAAAFLFKSEIAFVLIAR
jgi:hypothetical protein